MPTDRLVRPLLLPEMGRRDAASGLLGASGHIVNVSSVASHFVWPGATAYTAARWAVRGFTDALRADLTGMRPMCYVISNPEGVWPLPQSAQRDRWCS